MKGPRVKIPHPRFLLPASQCWLGSLQLYANKRNILRCPKFSHRRLESGRERVVHQVTAMAETSKRLRTSLKVCGNF